jgi:hypothetical protein
VGTVFEIVTLGWDSPGMRGGGMRAFDFAQGRFCGLRETCKIWFDGGWSFGYGANHKWEDYPLFMVFLCGS